MRTIAIINQKGGCGKTTTAINLAGLLARAGNRTLLVDMDPQSHCAAGLGVPENRIDMDIGDAMLAAGTRAIDGQRLFWRAGRNLDLAPSRMRLAGLEARRGGLSELPDKDRRLARVLADFQSAYDIAIIDCSPAIGLLTFNALSAASAILIPVETSFFSLQGATRQFNTVKTMARRVGVSVPVWVLPTIHDESNDVANDLLVELRRRFKDRLAPVVIRRDSKLKEAASYGQTIFDYAPSSTGAEDYTHLATWVSQFLQTVPHRAFDAAGQSEPDPSEAIDPALVEMLPGTPADQVGDYVFPPVADLGSDAEAESASDPSSELAVGAAGAEGELETPATHLAGATSSHHGRATELLSGTAHAAANRSVSRAEDVAKRAEQFFRRFATGQSLSVTEPAAQPAMMSQPARPVTETITGQGAFAQPGYPTTTVQPATLTPAPAGQVQTLRSESASPSPGIAAIARSLLGVRVTSQGVLFVQPLAAGEQVCIAGDFNKWSPTTHIMRKNRTLGVFELCIPLPTGTTRYRIVVDGVWMGDPYNKLCEANPFGEPNNIVVVPPELGSDRGVRTIA